MIESAGGKDRMTAEVGSILNGKVTRIMPFGAFIQTDDGLTGLVHISEVGLGYVSDVSEHLKVGDKVSAMIIKIENDGKINFSIKRALKLQKEEPKKKERIRPADIDWGKKPEENLSFEDKLSKFKMISDENMADLKRSNESKRSGGYKRGGGYY